MGNKEPERGGVDKDALKALRETRKTRVEAATARMRAQKKRIRAIRDCLASGPRTVPSIAAAIEADTAETLWYVAALKKYGEVRESEKDGAYFTYELAGETAGGEFE